MRYIIYTLYVATVLLFSGFARAQSPLPVEPPRSRVTILEVLVDSENLQLAVSGYVPNPCHQIPTPVMTLDNANTLVIRLISPVPTNFCIQRIQDYSTIVSLRHLAKASRLPLEAAAVYTVKTEGHDFSMQVSGLDLIQ
jgi:hypothetical protein